MNNLKNIEIYEKNILAYENKDIVIKHIICENCIEYSANFEGCELRLNIDTNTHIINSSSTNDCDDSLKSGIMKAFCEIITELPILEANDHGVLRLEHVLRDSVVHTVKGIIMPENSFKLFTIPLKLIRQIYTQYSKEQNYNPVVNIYNPKEIKEWKKLDISEREKIVYERIDYFCKQHNIKDYKATLIGDVRVEFVAEKNDALAKLLFDIETNISKELGFSLEVMFTEKQDSNKKRKN